jgi:beta-ribofuranosylaminobenzene 5'-phosphate synthase
MLKIYIPSRIHITLIAMHNCELRKNGGIGFSINNTGAFASFTKAKKNKITVNGQDKSCRKIIQITDRLDYICKSMSLKHSANISVHDLPDFHCGLGSGTSLTLACIEGLLMINDATYSDEDLIKLSKRGGTSGVGIQTYFTGGFILDVGISADRESHTPSSYVEKIAKHPLVICRSPMPDWKIGVIIPKHSSKIESESELGFFNRVCPIHNHEAFETCYLSIFGIAGAIIEKNYDSFSESLRRIQKSRWKSEEIKSYDDTVQRQIEHLLSLGADCAGMSSIGPAIYFFGSDISEIINKFKEKYECFSFIAEMNNTGRTICWN